MRRCKWCGMTDAWPFLRKPISWLAVAGAPVCSADCGAKLAARNADPVLPDGWLDASWPFETPKAIPGWRTVEPWWHVGPAGYLMLELDASIGAGWMLIRRGRGSAGPFATWEEAVRS